jgi:hypothetical protein
VEAKGREVHRAGMLLANFWTIFLRKIEITKRTMEIHARSQHMGIDDKNLFTGWTSYFNSLAHDSSSMTKLLRMNCSVASDYDQ